MHLSPSFALLALRAWWPIVVVLGMLGATLGVYSVGRAPYSATTFLRVDVSTNPLHSQEIVQTALQMVDSDPVYFKATDGSRETADELRARTVVGLADKAAVLKVTVTAPTAQRASDETDRFANAATEHIAETSREAFDRATKLAQEAEQQGVVPNPRAEERRLEGLGENLAQAQDSAYRQITLVTRIGGVQEPEQLGLPPRLAAPLGAIIGALAGVVAALVLGVRRRRIRRPFDVKAIGPGIRVYGARNVGDGLLRVAARCATLDEPLVAILALPDAENSLNDVRDKLRRQLGVERLRWLDIDADDFGHSSVVDRRSRERDGSIVPVRSARASALAEADSDVIVVTGTASTRAVKEAGARADVVVLVGRLRKTRIGELSTVYAEVADASPIVALLPPAGEAAVDLQDEADRQDEKSDAPVVAPEPAAAPATPSPERPESPAVPAPPSPLPRVVTAAPDSQPVGADAPDVRPTLVRQPDPFVAEVPAGATLGGSSNGNGHVSGQVEAHPGDADGREGAGDE